MESIASGLAGAMLLVFIYRHLRTNWPQNYFGPRESIAHFISGNIVKYCLFRFAPPYLVFLSLSVYFGTRSLIVATTSYIALSTILSIRSSVQNAPDSTPLTKQRLTVLLIVAAGLAATGTAAHLTSSPAAKYAPPFADVVLNVLSAAIVAALTAAFIFGTSNAEPASPRGMSDDLGFAIRMIALDNGADDRLAVSIALAEDAQRPYWFRRIENRLWRLNRSGSYGLFQVSGQGPMDDISSCRSAMPAIRGQFPLLHEYGFPVEWSVRAAAELHNPDHKFSEMVLSAYTQMHHPRIAESTVIATDGRPQLEIVAVGRFGTRMRARGTVWLEHGEGLVVEAHTTIAAFPSELPVTLLQSAASRRATWFSDLSIATYRLEVRTISEMNGCIVGESLGTDLKLPNVARDLSLRSTALQPTIRATTSNTGTT